MNKTPKTNLGVSYNILKWGLLGYSAWRSFDILSSTLPPEQKIVAVFGLLGLDVGVLLWADLFENKAHGQQVSLCKILVALDLAGVSALMIADTIMHSALKDQYINLINTVSVWISSIIIIFNIIGGITYPMLDPTAEARRREKELEEAYRAKQRETEWQLQLANQELELSRTRATIRDTHTQAGALHLPPSQQFQASNPWLINPPKPETQDPPKKDLLEILLTQEQIDKLGGIEKARAIAVEVLKKYGIEPETPKA